MATNDAVLERAHGVLAERFGTDIETAGRILVDVARVQRRSVDELAVEVVASCTGSNGLPRSLYSRDEAA